MFWGLGKNLLGIDISSASVKIVQLKHHGADKPTLITYASSPLPSYIIQSDSKTDHQKIADIIKETLKKARVSCRKAIATLGGESAFIYIIKLPQLPKKDLPEAVKWEARKYLSVPLEEVKLDWRIIEKPIENEKEKIKILVAAAPKNLVHKYTQILSLARIELVSLEPEASALARAYRGQESTVLILDIGVNNAQIVIADQEIVRATFNVKIGGNALTSAISTSLKVDRKTAEEFKRDFGMEENKFEGQIYQALAPLVNTILKEVKNCLDDYKKQKAEDVKKIILSGGSANLPELSTYLAKNFNLEVEVGNPWIQTNFSPQLSEKIENLGPSFATCIGAGLKEI